MYRIEVPAFPDLAGQAETIDSAAIAARLLIREKLRSLRADGVAAPSIQDYLPQLEQQLRVRNRLLHVLGVETYRRGAGGDAWHCCANCEGWPEGGFDESVDLPEGGELCNECLALKARRLCHV